MSDQNERGFQKQGTIFLSKKIEFILSGITVFKIARETTSTRSAPSPEMRLSVENNSHNLRYLTKYDRFEKRHKNAAENISFH